MHVALPTLQRTEVMIEAAENHNPEVIVIDERPVSRRWRRGRLPSAGTSLHAHGNTLDNLLLNPTLSDLVGGIESADAFDEEARRRARRRPCWPRRAPPTFDILVEDSRRGNRSRA